MKALKRCRNSNPVLIDLETYNINNVIDIDVPEKHTKKQGGVKEKSHPSKTVYIYIDDDESPLDHHPGQSARNSEKGASSSRRYVPDASPVKISKGKRTYSGRRFSAPSDIELSDDDGPDCEYIEDPSAEIREQWERASLKRKGDLHNDHNNIGVDKNKHKRTQDAKSNRTRHEKRGESSARKDVKENLSDHDLRDNVDLDGGLNRNKQKYDQDSKFNRTRHAEKGESSACSANFSDYEARDTVDGGKDDIPSTSNAEKNEKNDLENDATVDDDVPVEDSIISEREKLKETDEYKRALEEELAERQRALKIQAEEAQHLRLMLKRKKAQSLRILDMERRQKQRVDEIRESQKKDEENMNLKEQYRGEVIEGLKKLEITCIDMASLLRGLGIEVGEGPVPLSHEVCFNFRVL
ncbi:dnaJ domain-containing protein [Artemisia annua]|uniref:DnaJ domain-containing protein n=1 Tax=Artemisia annua TaxID=35608 RepID=A0A2U1P6I2_ARTAN|nr:dnaJ domain-containing protein [Artemisia annua]